MRFTVFLSVCQGRTAGLFLFSPFHWPPYPSAGKIIQSYTGLLNRSHLLPADCLLCSRNTKMNGPVSGFCCFDTRSMAANPTDDHMVLWDCHHSGGLDRVSMSNRQTAVTVRRCPGDCTSAPQGVFHCVRFLANISCFCCYRQDLFQQLSCSMHS